MAARYPAHAAPIPLRATGRKRRVGVVSGYFRRHSNWKIPIKGWVDTLNRSKFNLFGYYTDTLADDCTGDARRLFPSFREGFHPLEKWMEWISKDELDVLLFPEVGMDMMTARLAALRLAPVQCASWGHPSTTGLPTIDYFLSSELMEPEGAAAHYTEKLVLLPNLSVVCEPVAGLPSPKGRVDFGLGEKDVVYWCCQSTRKYLPRYDDVFARIALQVPQARFVFVSQPSAGEAVFRRRLQAAFERVGLRVEAHCTLLPILSAVDFAAVSRLSDVFLDAIGWSGCNSTLEAIEFNLPIVTLPGDTMRSRHSAAICKRMAVDECVASSVDEYVERAVELGRNEGKRHELRAKIRANKGRLYRDGEVARALETFLEGVG